jgi:hypothetical protein
VASSLQNENSLEGNSVSSFLHMTAQFCSMPSNSRARYLRLPSVSPGRANPTPKPPARTSRSPFPRQNTRIESETEGSEVGPSRPTRSSVLVSRPSIETKLVPNLLAARVLSPQVGDSVIPVRRDRIKLPYHHPRHHPHLYDPGSR